MKLEESNVSLKSTASELDVVAVKGELAAESESGLANSSSLADWLLAKSAWLFCKLIQSGSYVGPMWLSSISFLWMSALEAHENNGEPDLQLMSSAVED